MSTADPAGPVLSWAERDIEQRLGFRGGRFTRVNNVLTFLLGLALAAITYGAAVALDGSRLSAMLTERGPTPYAIVLLSGWSLAILLIKSRKLALQRRALEHDVVPSDHDFVLSSATVADVLHRIQTIVDDPRRFVLFNRIVIALSNLRNLGRVADVDDILRSQAANDESAMHTSYAVVQGFVWAIPVLGFIGTVLGLSDAIAGFGSILGKSAEVDQLADALRSVTGGLDTAFDTTLEALVCAMVIQLFLTFLKKNEEEFLDACADYCVRNVVGRLRVMPFQGQQE